MDERKLPMQTSNLIMDNRNKLTVSGVLDVDSFNEECIVTDTCLGLLIIRGRALHINKLNIEKAELHVEGDIISCEYIDEKKPKSGGFGLFGRMFG